MRTSNNSTSIFHSLAQHFSALVWHQCAERTGKSAFTMSTWTTGKKVCMIYCMFPVILVTKFR